MSQATEQLKHLGGMLDAQVKILRVLKRGHFPASVSGDVERGINYLRVLNTMAKQQMKVLEIAVKAEKKDPTVETPTDVA